MNKGLLGNPIFELKKIEITQVILRINRNDLKCDSWFEHESKFNLVSFSKRLLKDNLSLQFCTTCRSQNWLCYLRDVERRAVLLYLVKDYRLPVRHFIVHSIAHSGGPLVLCRKLIYTEHLLKFISR